MLVDGADMTGAPAHQFARAGIIHAPEGRSVFATLTVEENLVLSFRRLTGAGGRSPPTSSRRSTLFPALANRRKQLAGTLSGGEQRMLAMARVLVEEPKLLVADELSLGLAPIIVDEVYAEPRAPARRRAPRCSSSSSTSATRWRCAIGSCCSTTAPSRGRARPPRRPTAW